MAPLGWCEDGKPPRVWCGSGIPNAEQLPELELEKYCRQGACLIMKSVTNRAGLSISPYTVSMTPNIYRSFEMELKGSPLAQATLSFAVEKSWLDEQGINESSITLLHQKTSWEALPAEAAGSNSTHYMYRVTVSNFSVFAIAVRPQRSEPTRIRFLPAESPPPEASEIPATQESPGRPAWRTAIALLAATIILGGAALGLLRRRPNA